MAVYTKVEKPQMLEFLADYGAVGSGFTAEGLEDGVENTNYLISGDSRYILTIFERRVEEADLPFFFSLMEHLGKKNFPCPLPLKNKQGQWVTKLAGKPACLVNFLEGEPVPAVELEHCRQVGEILARLHRAAADFPKKRENRLGPPHFAALYRQYRQNGGEANPQLEAELERTVAAFAALRLPVGVIHGDLFVDNVFFKNGRLSGVIDFYFAATDILAYDLAVAINAWCFTDGEFKEERAAALKDGYRRGGMPNVDESAMTILLKAAAMRFWLTRLIDSTRSVVRNKAPEEFATIFNFHNIHGKND